MKQTLAIAGAMLSAMMVFAAPAEAQDERVWHVGVSLLGEPKYDQGFERFDYVNPDAPKGGTVRLSLTGSFDTFNPVPPLGEVATPVGLVYETLLTPALDEASTSYGLLAEAVSYPDDFASATFRINPRAKWHDGQPVTAEDVVWSFQKAVELSTFQANYYRNVTKAEVSAPGEVTFTFDETGNRELPSIIGQLMVMPKHWWEGKDANGKQRDIGASTLETPMGSGPYELASFSAGRSLTFKRVEDYWGANEPVNVGSNNFDEIRYEYFRDTTVEFEAFKGDQFDWWDENMARRWATAYDFPAATSGRVIKELYPNAYRDRGVMVGFLPNLRLEKFKDMRVRKALNYAFDFEELKRTLFYDQYDRINSYYFGTELASSGLPQGEELEILETVRGKVPESVFTEPYANPVGGDGQKLRTNLREALKLLTEAGYKLEGNRLVDANGVQLAFEILLNGPTIEPVALAFQTNLRSIGVDASVRSVDSPQFINRQRSRDFDVIYNGWSQTLSPGNEQRDMWGSAAAEGADSYNHMGIADPAIDTLIDKVIFADDRETLIAATHALDRVLLANHFLVPAYTLREQRVAHWDRFSHPETLPEFSVGFPTIWWWDETKAAKTGN